MVIFRENTEDIYAGIDCRRPAKRRSLRFLEGIHRVSSRSASARRNSRRSASARRCPATSGRHRHQAGQLSPARVRLIHSAIEYAISNKRKSVTIVHKGNIMKFTEGAFRDWGYAAGQKRIRRGGNRRRPVVQNSRRQTRRGPRDQGRHRRHHAAAGAHAPDGFRRDRHAEPERRLPERRARGAGRRHRHRARRQHQLHHRPRHLRSHARHRAEVRQQGRGEPRLASC